VITNLALNGLGPIERVVTLIAMFALVGFGFFCLAGLQNDLPLWMRSRRWIEREKIAMRKNPTHPLHESYWGNSDGATDRLKWAHEEALEYMDKVYKESELRKQSLKARLSARWSARCRE
jgi:hypothetical protein